MAIMTIRSTFALDPDTVQALENLAKRWGVSKSEALRRSIHASAATRPRPAAALEALDNLQRSLRLSNAAASHWIKHVREERIASSKKRLRGR